MCGSLLLGEKEAPKPGACVLQIQGVGDLLWVGQNCLNGLMGLVWKAAHRSELTPMCLDNKLISDSSRLKLHKNYR